MKVEDVELEEGRIQVIRKGRRQRYMPIGRAARRALEEYLATGSRELAGVADND